MKDPSLASLEAVADRAQAVGDRERWAPVRGRDGYEVSSRGRVRSWRKRGGGRRREPLVRKLGLTRDGYPTVMLSVDGRRTMELVHVLVLEAFVAPRPRGRVAAHLDGDRRSNHLHNLAWVTPEENEAHKLRHGTASRGESSGTAKLTRRQVLAIRDSYDRGRATFEELGRLYGVTGRQIAYIVRGERWAHVMRTDERGQGVLL